ncbi:MAG: preprotein translocase subunit YajC [Alphaproteobacteria bacterium]|nr:preprotein translocase subunit YajC [Alphaproteobacteria bacterium]
MFSSPAFAQAAGGAPGGFDIIALAPLVLIFVVFYFLIIRPQQKKMKDHKAMIEALRRGDRIVTSGGIIGTVTKIIDDREMALEVADGVRVKVLRSMVAEVLARTGAPDAKDAKEEKKSSEPDFYKVLGVKSSATVAEIDAAFAPKSDDPKAVEAYDTLKDPVKRKLYDSLGHDQYVSRIR